MEKNNEEKVNQNLKLIFKSSAIVFFGLVFSKIFTYLYRIIIARYYGPEVYGLFSLAVMVLGFFVAFFSFGFQEGLLRFISTYRGKNEKEKISYVVKFSIIFSLISSFFSSIILFFSAEFISINIFHSSDLILFLKIFSFLIPIYIFANIFLSILHAFEKISWHSFILNILQNAIKVFTLLFFIFLGLKTNAVIFSFFLGIFSMFLAGFLFCKYKIKNIFRRYVLNKEIKTQVSKDFLSYSWPLLFTGIISTLLIWIDTFSIGYFLGVIEVGIYNAAIPIVILIRFAPELFLKLFSPLITKEFHKGNKELVKELSQQVGKWIFFINLPFFLLILLFPESIINLFFGQEYLSASNALRILSFGAFAISSVFISSDLLAVVKKSKLMLFNLIGVSLVNFTLNFILVPKYGLEGAAIATTTSNLILATAFFFQAKHYTSIIPLKKNMLKIFLVSLIPFILVFFMKKFIFINFFSFILLATFFSLSYFLLLFITKCLDEKDFMILKTIKEKIIRG
jgi:O-antigen/teichoic acid export membrane protein